MNNSVTAAAAFKALDLSAFQAALKGASLATVREIMLALGKRPTGTRKAMVASLVRSLNLAIVSGYRM